MSILKLTDFENGPLTIPLNGEQETDLTLLITDVEREYLACLFGKELYIIFKADVDANGGVPVLSRFVKVFEAFLEQPDSVLHDSKGIKEMLKGIVYYEWTKDMPTRLATVGIKKTLGENSENVGAIAHDITIKYNRAIRTYCEIQWYMSDEKPENYEEYEGVPKSKNHSF